MSRSDYSIAQSINKKNYLFNFWDRDFAASSTGLPRAKWGLGNSRAREKREGGMMGMSVELIINSIIPKWSRATGDEAGDFVFPC